jgi:L-lactate dehydrogenase (cytochrome)
MKAASILDYREAARRRLPHFLFEYIDGGSHAEVTLRRNISDLEDVALRQRVLRDGSSLDLSTTLFGQSLARRSGWPDLRHGGARSRRCARPRRPACPSRFRLSPAARWRR